MFSRTVCAAKGCTIWKLRANRDTGFFQQQVDLVVFRQGHELRHGSIG
jgi:hypothetical protein